MEANAEEHTAARTETLCLDAQNTIDNDLAFWSTSSSSPRPVAKMAVCQTASGGKVADAAGVSRGTVADATPPTLPTYTDTDSDSDYVHSHSSGSSESEGSAMSENKRTRRAVMPEEGAEVAPQLAKSRRSAP